VIKGAGKTNIWKGSLFQNAEEDLLKPARGKEVTEKHPNINHREQAKEPAVNP
jgi:hypothetical protein